MTISVCIPVRNESPELLIEVLHNLTHGCPYDELEVLLYNDGSVNPDGTFASLHNLNFPQRIKNYLKIIESEEQYGIGYGLDRLVEHATGTIVVIAGADTFAQRSWFSYVKNHVKPKEIGVGVSIGLQPGNYDINQEGLYARYGAKILWTMNYDDLPKQSPLRKYPDYRDICEPKWMPKQSDEPYEIPCAYGAFYWLTKEFYQKIHGWDTEEGKHFRGAMLWGNLECHLSVKAKVYGGKCMLYPDFKVGHCFGRIEDIYKVRAVRNDIKYWNKLFMCHTLLDDDFRDEILAFPHHSLNLSQAKAYIKQNMDYIQGIRQRNKREGKLLSKGDC